MKTTFLVSAARRLFPSLLLAATLGWGHGAAAQGTPALTVLHTFTGAPDGSYSSTALVLASDGNFYGTAENGGTGGAGTVFKLTPAGAYSTFYNFTAGTDGGNPKSPLLQASDGNLYGMTYQYGGPSNSGTAFKMTLAGVLTTLRDFSGMDGHRPQGNLTQATDGNIYATTGAGGSSYVNPQNVGTGNVIKITLSGAVSSLASLQPLVDGDEPLTGVVQASDGNLYGASPDGPHDNGDGTSSRSGNVFKVTTAGMVTNFSGFNLNMSDAPRNPNRIIQGSDGNFYGTSFQGGSAGTGTVFKIAPDGTVTTLHEFAADTHTPGGKYPQSGLLEATDGNFYGTTTEGGASAAGTIFKIAPDGTFTTVYTFDYDNEGAEPDGDLIEGSDGNLYGTTHGGGSQSAGTIFRLNLGLPPPLVTTFTVNESSSPTAAAPDSVLRFRASENHTAAGLLVHVQSSTATAPAPESSWNDLPDGLAGQMAYAPQVTAYILNSTNYPAVNGVSFRTVTRAPGYPTAVSNVVGPFNLQSSTPHLGPTLLFVTTNGEVNAIRFGVNQSSIPSGIAVRIQTSQTPADEPSWTNAPIGTSGHMTQDTTTPDLNQFYLGTDDYPASEGVYFRAVATAPGKIDSLSFPYGPFKFVNDPPATVTITLNGVSTSPNDIDSGYLLASGAFNMQANASSGRMIKRLTLLFDGNTLEHFDNGATTGSLDYLSNIPGDHIIEAYATDDLGVTGAAAPIHVRILPPAPGKIYTMTASGNWNTASNWVDIQGNPGVPGPHDFAVVSTFSPILTTDVTVNAMSLNGGTLEGTKTLTVTAFCTIADGTIKANLNIPVGATAECLNDSDITLTGNLTYAGTMRLHGKGGIGGMHTTANRGSLVGPQPDGLFDFVGGIINGVGKFIADLASGGRRGSKATPAPIAMTPPEKRTIAAATVNVAAGSVISVPAPSALITQDGGGLITQDGGGLVAQGGGNLVAQGGGNLVAQGGGNLVAQGGGNLISQDGGGLVASGGGNLVATGGGNLVASGGGNLVAQGGGNAPARSGNAATATPAPTAGISLSGGEIDLSGFTVYGSIAIDGGILSGSGIILGDLANNSGYLTPGAIAVSGDFSQGADGTLIIQNGGASPDQFDLLLVSGSAALGGKLDVKLINGYRPDPADTFNPLGYASATGAFASVSANAQVTQNATGLLLTNNPAIANPKAGQPLNISTRLRVLTDNKVLIGGFIVSGPIGSTKAVLIRGLGPSLSGNGVAGSLADPLLELHTPSSTVTNDNWGDAPDKQRIPAGFAPTDPHESVIIADLAPGAYTVIEKGAHGETGVGLTDIYDLDAASAAQLANISTRGFVDTGDNAMIGGFIVGGNEPAQVLVRATGPSLALPPNNLAGVLADPELELHDANGGVIANDDWRATQEAAIQATTLAPADDREPAILATLVPGGYTAVVRGKGDTAGIAVIEAYSFQ